MSQFQRQRIFRNKKTKETSTKLINILPKSLTVDPAYRIQTHESKFTTLFKETEIVRPIDTLGEIQKKLIGMSPGTSKMSHTRETNGIIKAIEKYIESSWHPDKFHLVYHSSGIDSRIMSGLIKKIYQRNGHEWLGKVLFVCFGPEGFQFERIMEYQEWEEDQYFSVKNLGEYLQRNVGNFKTAGRWLNGPTRGCHNLNYTLTELLQAQGLIPESDKEIQIFNGYGSDYEFRGAMDPNDNRLGSEFEKGYKAITSTSFFKVDDVIYPFLAYSVLGKLIKARFRYGYGIRGILLERIDPTLAAFSRVSRQIIKPLPGELFNRLVLSYQRSWYGQTVRSNAIPVNKFEASDWWADWTAAAYCEYLAEKGYSLDV